MTALILRLRSFQLSAFEISCDYLLQESKSHRSKSPDSPIESMS